MGGGGGRRADSGALWERLVALQRAASWSKAEDNRVRSPAHLVSAAVSRPLTTDLASSRPFTAHTSSKPSSSSSSKLVKFSLSVAGSLLARGGRACRADSRLSALGDLAGTAAL